MVSGAIQVCSAMSGLGLFMGGQTAEAAHVLGTEGILLKLVTGARCRHLARGYVLSGVNICKQNRSPMRPCIRQCPISVRGVFGQKRACAHKWRQAQ